MQNLNYVIVTVIMYNSSPSLGKGPSLFYNRSYREKDTIKLNGVRTIDSCKHYISPLGV